MDAGLRVRGKGAEELSLELSSLSSMFMCMQLLKSVNVFFSEDTWLRGSTGLGIILIKIIYMSCHKFPVLWLCLLLLGFWMNRFCSSLSLD